MSTDPEEIEVEGGAMPDRIRVVVRVAGFGTWAYHEDWTPPTPAERAKWGQLLPFYRAQVELQRAMRAFAEYTNRADPADLALHPAVSESTPEANPGHEHARGAGCYSSCPGWSGGTVARDASQLPQQGGQCRAVVLVQNTRGEPTTRATCGWQLNPDGTCPNRVEHVRGYRRRRDVEVGDTITAVKEPPDPDELF